MNRKEFNEEFIPAYYQNVFVPMLKRYDTAKAEIERKLGRQLDDAERLLLCFTAFTTEIDVPPDNSDTRRSQ